MPQPTTADRACARQAFEIVHDPRIAVGEDLDPPWQTGFGPQCNVAERADAAVIANRGAEIVVALVSAVAGTMM